MREIRGLFGGALGISAFLSLPPRAALSQGWNEVI